MTIGEEIDNYDNFLIMNFRSHGCISFRSSSPITSARAGLAMLLLNVRFGSFEAFTCAVTSRVALTRILLLKMLTHQ
jgi:hypothetical protein